MNRKRIETELGPGRYLLVVSDDAEGYRLGRFDAHEGTVGLEPVDDPGEVEKAFDDFERACEERKLGVDE